MGLMDWRRLEGRLLAPVARSVRSSRQADMHSIRFGIRLLACSSLCTCTYVVLIFILPQAGVPRQISSPQRVSRFPIPSRQRKQQHLSGG